MGWAVNVARIYEKRIAWREGIEKLGERSYF